MFAEVWDKCNHCMDICRASRGGVSFVWKTLYSDIYFKIYQRLLSIVLKNIAFIDGMMPHIALALHHLVMHDCWQYMWGGKAQSLVSSVRQSWHIN